MASHLPRRSARRERLRLRWRTLFIPAEYTLQLKASDGTVVKEVQVQQGSTAWTVTLAAGEYNLTEVNHPQWLCRITVD